MGLPPQCLWAVTCGEIMAKCGSRTDFTPSSLLPVLVAVGVTVGVTAAMVVIIALAVVAAAIVCIITTKRSARLVLSKCEVLPSDLVHCVSQYCLYDVVASDPGRPNSLSVAEYSRLMV